MSTTVDAPPREDEDQFTPRVHVYEPHRVGLPPLIPYAKELWRRREFAKELSRTSLRSQHFDTVFGQLWLILNPLLLGLVYFLLTSILHKHKHPQFFFAHLMAGLFLYYFLQQALSQGVKSVTSGGKLILNSAFPRLLLPLAAVRTAFMRFLPTMLIYIPVHIATGVPITWNLFFGLLVILILVVFGTGCTMILSAGQVYFRDIQNFLPYVLRIWLYITPILYYGSEVTGKLRIVLDANPIGLLFNSWSEAVNKGHTPSALSFAVGGGWALLAIVVGTLFFMSRERDFAVRV